MSALPEIVQEKLEQGARMADRAISFGQSVASVGSGVVRERVEEIRLPGAFMPRAGDRFVAAAYFSSGEDSVYQILQWLWPFERLSAELAERGHGERSLAIFTRSARVATLVASATDLPVRFSRLSRGLDAFMLSDSLRLVFYVNQAKGNFQSLRFPRPAHVHLSHGESEKISMISNQLKAYDYVFTAGHAARARITDTLIGMTEDRMIDIGRPQLDRPRAVPQLWQSFDAQAPSGPVVFYAPTWEGDSAAMAYGTLAHNGETMVRSLLDAGYRVIFRPHPRTGVVDKQFAVALEEVRLLVAAHPRGFLDTSPDVSWQFDVAEVALAEMSSVAFDWLSTRKPLVMVSPRNPDAEVLPGGLFDRCPTIESAAGRDVAGLVEATAAGFDGDTIAEEYLGDTSSGCQIRRFIDASAQVIAQRSAALGDAVD